MPSLLLLVVASYPAARLIVPQEKSRHKPSSVLDRNLLSDLDGDKSRWTKDQMKLYMQGVEDDTTVVTFSVKVFYSLEEGDFTGGKITNFVDKMIVDGNKRLEELGALAKMELHCLEQMTWTAEDVISTFARIGGNSYYKNGERNSADAVLYVATMGGCGWGALGGGLSSSFTSFYSNLESWIELSAKEVTTIYGDACLSGTTYVHELGHNLGLSHNEMYQKDNETYYGRVFKELRFALASVGDESEACPKQEADWEFRSHCFTSFGHYTGAELENEGRTTEEKNAKECQARCAATDGCSFFTFKEVGAGCHLSSSAAQPVRAEGVIGGPLPCEKNGWFAIKGSLMLSHQKPI